MEHPGASAGPDTPVTRHVLVLNQYALPRERGGGTRHVDLFGRLPDWRPLIVAAGRDHYTQETFRTNDPRFQLVWIPAYRGNGPGRVVGWAIYAIQAAVLGLSRRHLDVVYASTPSLLAPVAGWLVARLRRRPLVVEVRDLWPETLVGAGALRRESLLHRVLRGLERRVMRAADHIVAVTPGWEDHFAGFGVHESVLTVIPNGAEPGPRGVSDDLPSVRPDGEHRLVAVYAGAHGPLNGIDLILRAAAELPEMDFLLIGAGSAKPAAVARARAEDLANVRFRDPVAKSELLEVLSECDVGIHCIMSLPLFRRGMSPNKVFDYFAAGLPVVSNAREGLSSIFADGECGRLGEADDLTACLRDVQAAGRAQRELWGNRGRELLAKRFSRSTAAASLRTVLESVREPEAEVLR